MNLAPPRLGPLARLAFGTAVALVLLLALRAARPLLLPLVFAPILTLLLAAPLRWLQRRGVPEPVGAALIVSALSGSICGIGALLAEPAARWWYTVPTALRSVLDALTRLHRDVLETGSVDALRNSLATEGISLTRLVLGDVLLFSVEASATAVLLYFMLIGQRSLLGRVLVVLPTRRARIRLLSTLRHVERDIRRFIGTMTLANIALGAASGVALAALGLPHAGLWAVTIAVLAFIPYIGPLLITLMLLIAASLAFGSGPYMFVPAAVFLGLHALEANLISPWWMGYRLKLSRVAVFVGVMVFGWAWGVAGGFLAVPLLLVLRAATRGDTSLALLNVWLEAESTPLPGAAALSGEAAQVRRLPR